MGDKREFFQRYPPDVLLPLDASSDIHYGRNHKNSGCLTFSIINEEITRKKSKKKHNWCYCFLRPVDPASAMLPEIISPAIAMNGGREIAEGEEATG